MATFDPRSIPLDTAEHPALPALDAERLRPEALRRRLAQPPAHWLPELVDDRVRLPGRTGEPVPAAVLVPIVTGTPSAVLLTRRTAHLSSHAGQIALPGGRCDPGDRDAEAAALREAHEEIGLAPGAVEVIGRLPDYRTGTGYRITPVVGLVAPDVPLAPQPAEVDEIFQVPLAWLMDPARHLRHRVELGDGGSRTFYAMPWRAPVDGTEREYYIWGATAAMLRNLYRLLAA